MDSTGDWYRATVLEVTSIKIRGKNVIMLKVGFKRYTNGGTKKDNEGREYEGWKEIYDELVNAFSLRVQRADSIGKIGKINCRKEAEEPSKDDVNDVLLNEIKGIYATLKPRKTSKALIDAINKFGAKGGFKNMLDKIKERSCSYSKV
eukprot:TRINITY_DN15212_c0_g4_i2.p1 TRINITY_DN15212_c0_g4~~TRINITY_DN15212_c0_g4_i2.p1  ORF type:complete len:148 (-),score=43.81 TRINITY_DN15212_c0_g4_i2:376-819(-)